MSKRSVSEVSATQSADVIVLGAGVSGLAHALARQQKGFKVIILEQMPQIGGAIQTRSANGFLFEPGPNSMLLKSPEVASFLQQLGILERLIPANSAARNRFLVRNGRMLAAPSGLLSAITTPLYSLPAKLRLLAEPFIAPGQGEDESVTDFVSRRLGREFLDYGIAALVAGIYAGNPDALSLRYAFPKVWNLEQRYGSLIRGSIGLARDRKRSGQTKFSPIILSHRDGLSSLVHGLAGHLQNPVLTGVQMTEIARIDGHWSVTYQQTQGLPMRVTAPRIVVTVPVHIWPKLPFDAELSRQLSQVTCPPYVPVTTVFTGFKREQVAHALNGFGVLIPPREHCPVLGVSFNSTLFPNRAPNGCVGLTSFVGGALSPDAAVDDSSQLWQTLQPVLRNLLGVQGAPVFLDHCHWPKAIPQYDLNHAGFLRQVAALEAQFPGLIFLGNFKGGPGLNDCIFSAIGLP